MTELWPTLIGALIGAVAAIGGGLLAVWWQTLHADDVARRIRREERQEEGLLALRAAVLEVHHEVGRQLCVVQNSASTDHVGPWRTTKDAVEGLVRRWRTDLSQRNVFGPVWVRGVVAYDMPFVEKVDKVGWWLSRCAGVLDERAVSIDEVETARQDFLRLVRELMAYVGDLAEDVESRVHLMRRH